MYEDDIKKVNEWFDKHTESYGTYRTEREYSVDSYDFKPFADFLGEEFPDLCYIRCHLGTGDSAIWFFEDDLKEACFY